jgi:para-aminobenzoate synthetase component I
MERASAATSRPSAVTVDELTLDGVSFYDIAEYYSRDPDFVLLDSQMTGSFSMLAFAPFAVFKSKGASGTIRIGSHETKFRGDPLARLDDLLQRYAIRSDPDEALPIPFAGGAIGYFSYELGRQIEVLPETAADDLQLPDCYLCFYNFAIARHHDSGKTYLCYRELPDDRLGLSRREIDAIIADVPAGRYRPERIDVQATGTPAIFTADFTRDEYCHAISRIKDYIVAGDVYQVNMTQRFHARVGATPPWRIFKALSRSNPADFAAYLNFDGHAIVSSSPERLLLLNNRRHVETRPIKGTIRRGATPHEDAANKAALITSTKNRAELAMIVDLLRNDLGRVCVPGSVHVRCFPELHSYASLHHLESTIAGVLENDTTIGDLMRAIFPGGSITGAPKIRAMEIIDELEPVTRGVYTGSIGYLSFDGSADLNIAIRTLVVKDGEAYVHAGGGIVADSDEMEEHAESLLKASKLLHAIEAVSAPYRPDADVLEPVPVGAGKVAG